MFLNYLKSAPEEAITKITTVTTAVKIKSSFTCFPEKLKFSFMIFLVLKKEVVFFFVETNIVYKTNTK